jgi:hypoxanthine phosphoribosyltransferase
MVAEKQFIDAQQLLEDSFQLGVQVLDSGFRPRFLVGVWRGGTPVGIAVQELLDYFGVHTDHIAIRTSSYSGIERRHPAIHVHGLQYIIDAVDADDGLLLIDDVFDTGLSVDAVIRTLRERARRNTPRDLRVAAVYYKPANNQTERVPDYYVHETDKWLVFPHELHGLTPAEIRARKSGVGSFVARL